MHIFFFLVVMPDFQASASV